jgi:hypothetical protein
LAHIHVHWLNAIRAGLQKRNSVSSVLKRLELGFFWLVVVWADFKPSPVFAKYVIGITLPTVIA